MKSGTRHAIAASLIATLATVACAGATEIQDGEVQPSPSFEVPFEGPGQLATIWSWGLDQPDKNHVLVLSDREGSRRIDVQAPTRVRWRLPTELLVEQFVRPVREGSGTRIVRMSREGEVLETLSDRDGLAHAEPSPDGRWVAVEHYSRMGLDGIEIRELDDDFALRTEHPDEGDLFTGVVWNPDGSQLAVQLLLPSPSGERGRLYQRLAIISRDTPGYTRLPDSHPGEKPENGGIIPLFWNEDGIYARATRIGSGLLKCDPDDSGCLPVYSPGEHRVVLKGKQSGDREALLLVKDFRDGPFEIRGKEIHKVNLATGEGHVLMRLPDGVFISDLDWIRDAGEL